MARHLLTYILLAGFATSTNAQQFSNPEQINHSGKTYSLVQQYSLNGQQIFEYTTNGETIQKWSSLVTLIYLKSINIKPLQWTEAIKTTLDNQKPIPHFSLNTDVNHGYAKIIYEPNSNNSFYESSVQKSFHIEKCGGALVYQFAQKYPASANQTENEKLATLKQIVDKNSKLTVDIEKSKWFPNCT